MALAIDASTPNLKLVPITGTSVASNVFSPPANSVIVLMVVTIGPSSSASSVSAVTDSLGTHLTWALIPGARSNTNSSGNLGGTCEIWYASCPNAQTNMTVTPTYTNPAGAGNGEGFVLPIVFTGAATTQNGAVATDPQTVAALPSKSVTTTRAGSRIIACALNYTNSTGPTPGTGQTNTINGFTITMTNSTDGDAAWGQMQTANTSASGTAVTMNDTAPSCKHNMVVAEILAITGGTINTQTLSVTGVGAASLTKQANRPKIATGVGTASLVKLETKALAVAGAGVPALLKLDIRMPLSVAGVGAASIVKAPLKTQTVSSLGSVSLVKLDRHTYFLFGIGGVSMAKLVTKPQSVADVGAVFLGVQHVVVQVLSVTGVGAVGLVKQVQPVKAVIGAGVPTIAKLDLRVPLSVVGSGIASVAKVSAQTLSVAGSGLVTVSKVGRKPLVVAGVGVVTRSKLVSKNFIVVGIDVATLAKIRQHTSSLAGVGVVSIVGIVVSGGPVPGFVELFVMPIATVDLADERRASVTLNLEPLTTVDLFLAKVG